MNTLPLVLENIILDYKNDLEKEKCFYCSNLYDIDLEEKYDKEDVDPRYNNDNDYWYLDPHYDNSDFYEKPFSILCCCDRNVCDKCKVKCDLCSKIICHNTSTCYHSCDECGGRLCNNCCELGWQQILVDGLWHARCDVVEIKI
jgi:hypothetical protein